MGNYATFDGKASNFGACYMQIYTEFVNFAGIDHFTLFRDQTLQFY